MNSTMAGSAQFKSFAPGILRSDDEHQDRPDRDHLSFVERTLGTQLQKETKKAEQQAYERMVKTIYPSDPKVAFQALRYQLQECVRRLRKTPNMPQSHIEKYLKCYHACATRDPRRASFYATTKLGLPKFMKLCICARAEISKYRARKEELRKRKLAELAVQQDNEHHQRRSKYARNTNHTTIMNMEQPRAQTENLHEHSNAMAAHSLPASAAHRMSVSHPQQIQTVSQRIESVPQHQQIDRPAIPSQQHHPQNDVSQLQQQQTHSFLHHIASHTGSAVSVHSVPTAQLPEHRSVHAAAGPHAALHRPTSSSAVGNMAASRMLPTSAALHAVQSILPPAVCSTTTRSAATTHTSSISAIVPQRDDDGTLAGVEPTPNDFHNDSLQLFKQRILSHVHTKFARFHEQTYQEAYRAALRDFQRLTQRIVNSQQHAQLQRATEQLSCVQPPTCSLRKFLNLTESRDIAELVHLPMSPSDVPTMTQDPEQESAYSDDPKGEEQTEGDDVESMMRRVAQEFDIVFA